MFENDLVKAAFTELAPCYVITVDKELFQFWGITYQAFVENLVRVAAVKPGEKVLDLATGTAVIPQYLAENMVEGNQLVGLDITPAMLAEGHKSIRERGKNHSIELVCASAMDMPFVAGVFDVVICGLGTHHMDVPKMLEETSRVLGKKGRLIISDVGASSFWHSWFGKILLRLLMIQYGLVNQSARARAEIEAFQNVRTAKEWIGLLSALGFVRIRVNEVKPRLPWFPSGLTLLAEMPTEIDK